MVARQQSLCLQCCPDSASLIVDLQPGHVQRTIRGNRVADEADPSFSTGGRLEAFDRRLSSHGDNASRGRRRKADSPVSTSPNHRPTTVGHVTQPPRDEFLPKPAWRARVGRRPRAIAIAATFALVLVLGGATLWLLFVVVRKLDAPGSVQLVVWLIPTFAVTTWAVRSRAAATMSDVESQGWSEYVVRFVMIGNETPRPVPLRVVTGIVFGAPVACYLIAITVLALAGIT
jgi:hypothetical protein